ncbi:MAG: DUF4294 domain-containing protein [Flavobacteriaceae bacterium]|nr:DUF4294 domain-containing protein [Flavobacteriaceae bacterium]
MNKIIILLLLITVTVFSQKRKKEIITDELILIENDSIIFDLEIVNLLKKLQFNNKKERRYYYWYWKKVHKAYPFATLTATTLKEVDKNLVKIKEKRKKKKYIRKAQKLLNKEFKEKLKKLTKTEGKILIRLIHRQTGLTAFNLIKKYRSGWKAFWYNSTANIFKLSLKKEYRPKDKALDFLVEDILQRAFVKETLKESKSKLDFDYNSLVFKYKNIDIVKVIDER